MSRIRLFTVLTVLAVGALPAAFEAPAVALSTPMPTPVPGTTTTYDHLSPPDAGYEDRLRRVPTETETLVVNAWKVLTNDLYIVVVGPLHPWRAFQQAADHLPAL